MTKSAQDALPVLVPNIHTDPDCICFSQVVRDQFAGRPLGKDAGCVQIGKLMSSGVSDPFAIVDIKEEAWQVVFVRSRCDAHPRFNDNAYIMCTRQSDRLGRHKSSAARADERLK